MSTCRPTVLLTNTEPVHRIPFFVFIFYEWHATIEQHFDSSGESSALFIVKLLGKHRYSGSPILPIVFIVNPNELYISVMN